MQTSFFSWVHSHLFGATVFCFSLLYFVTYSVSLFSVVSLPFPRFDDKVKMA